MKKYRQKYKGNKEIETREYGVNFCFVIKVNCFKYVFFVFSLLRLDGDT